MWLVPHTNKQQEANTVVVWLETDVGKKLPLTSFDATRVAWLRTVKVDLFWQLTSHSNVRETA